MAIQQQSRLSLRARPFGQDQRITAPSIRRALLETGAFQPIAHESGRAAHVSRVFGKRADAGNTEKADQIVQVQYSIASI